MAIITQQLKHTPTHITDHTNSIASECHAILFDNYGEQGAKIYINDTNHLHTGQYLYLPPGGHITLGNNENFLIKDVFDVVFTGSGSKAMNILKQFTDRIE